MRRRRVVALVLATALVFLVAGTALGYWAIPQEGTRAECIILANQLEDYEYLGFDQPSTSATRLASFVIDEYNRLCR